MPLYFVFHILNSLHIPVGINEAPTEERSRFSGETQSGANSQIYYNIEQHIGASSGSQE